mgnify:FL=1
MLNAFRLTDGFDISLFESRTGTNETYIKKQLNKAIELKLINIKNDMIKPTILGQKYLNSLIEIFIL